MLYSKVILASFIQGRTLARYRLVPQMRLYTCVRYLCQPQIRYGRQSYPTSQRWDTRSFRSDQIRSGSGQFRSIFFLYSLPSGPKDKSSRGRGCIMVHQLPQDPTSNPEQPHPRSPQSKMNALTQEFKLVAHTQPYSLSPYPG